MDLSASLSPKEVEAIRHLLLRYTVLVFRDQRLDPKDQVRFTRHFGEPDVHPLRQFHVPGHPEVVIVSNVFRDGEPIGIYDDNAIEWHVDHATSRRPSRESFLYSITAANVGGDTLFAAADAAYQSLAPGLKERINGLQARHSTRHFIEERRKRTESHAGLTAEATRFAMPDVIHPLVRTHPVTGRKSLMVGSLTIAEIMGLPDDEATRLVQELLEHATQDEFVYRHRWRERDLVCWDNRNALHTATPCDRPRHSRLLHRTSIREDVGISP